MKSHGSQDPESSENRGKDAIGTDSGFLPSDVAGRIFGSNTSGSADSKIVRLTSQEQRQAIIAAAIFPNLSYPRHPDAKGTEHTVKFRGCLVEKHQHSDGWMPDLDSSRQLVLRRASPLEYLRRLQFQNDLFGDQIRIIGLTPANRFVISQPTLRGGEPTENEIRDVLEQAGWQRLPIERQINLPIQLTGTAWEHEEEDLILLDARKPNFKKTEFGSLPIDLIIGDRSALAFS